MSECDISKCVVCKNYDLQRTYIKNLNNQIKLQNELLKSERKEGALEELYKLNYYCDKAQVDERAIKRMILKRIKELEGVEQK